MKINALCTDEQILQELGERVKSGRIRSGLTQEELSQESGTAKSTIERLEKGESVQLSNLVKVLRALRYLDSLDLLLPSLEKTPFEYIKQPGEEKKQRVRKSDKSPSRSTAFKWGDEK